MKTIRRITLTLGFLAVGAFVVAGGGPVEAQEEQDYLLATATTGGTYYPVGVAIATLVKVKLQPGQNIGMSAISSAGSGENVKLLRDNEVQFAILQGLFGAYARNGTGPLANDGPQENLCSISMLWQNVEHFILTADLASSGTMTDVAAAKGKSAALGARNSGTIGSNEAILGNLGYDIETDFDLVYAGYGPSAEALQNGQVVFMGAPAGVPVSAVTSAFANMGDDIKLLNFTDEQVTEANGDFVDLWTPYTIPAGTYPSVDEDIDTIAQPNFLAARCDLPEDPVHQITKTIHENLPFLQAIHPATKVMSLEAALPGLPVRLHPGAARYYTEAGLTIPDRLAAN